MNVVSFTRNYMYIILYMWTQDWLWVIRNTICQKYVITELSRHWRYSLKQVWACACVHTTSLRFLKPSIYLCIISISSKHRDNAINAVVTISVKSVRLLKPCSPHACLKAIKHNLNRERERERHNPVRFLCTCWLDQRERSEPSSRGQECSNCNLVRSDATCHYLPQQEALHPTWHLSRGSVEWVYPFSY